MIDKILKLKDLLAKTGVWSDGEAGKKFSLVMTILSFIMGGLLLMSELKPKEPTVDQSTQNSQVIFRKGSKVDRVEINQKSDTGPKKTVGIEMSVSSKDIGGGFVKYINDSWSVTVGGKYDFETGEGRPEVSMRHDFY